jgi:SAM-dependent methyltransferase
MTGVDRIRTVGAMNYNLAYAMGFHPWEDAEGCPEFCGRLMGLVADVERDLGEPFGRALDIGTGSGIWAVALARRGWQVTGIDIVAKALRRARARVDTDGVEVELVQGDVTRLREAGITAGYRLVVDTGTFHDFTREQRRGMGIEIDAIATSDAVVILTVWPARRRPLIRGVDRDGIEEAFPGWDVVDAGPSGYAPSRVLDAVLRPAEHFYLLERRH